MRNLTKALVAVSLLTSTSVHSLGIGGIKLRSALNQKLNAEIALVTSGNENVGDIQVKLASPAKFDQAGVPWSYFLTKIKFTPITKADGSVGVKLSSDEALKEPYLDFLVEVTGPNGTLFREFTVLVDPPASYKKPAVPVITHAARMPAQVEQFVDEVDAPVRQAKTIRPVTQQAYEDDNGPGNHASGEYDSAAGEYGPTQNSDTIWSIANQVKPDDISTEQMVMAIFAANRGAFAKPNVNKLLAGKILDIPDHDAVLRLSRHQAPLGLKQPRQEARTAASVAAHKPKPVQAGHGIVKAAKPVKHLKLNSPAVDAEIAEGEAAADTLKPVANNTPTGGATGSTEDADLKQRFEKIEQQLQMMQKMLELKDAQLASLQKQTNPAVAVEPSPELKLAEPVKTDPVIEPPIVNPLAAQPAAAVQPASTAPPITSAKAALPIPKAAPIAPKFDVAVATANPFADYYWLAGGAGASLLGALGLIWWRKRKVEKTIDTESMFASASQISLPDNDKEASPLSAHSSGYEVGTVGDSTFLSEFTPSEFDAFETDQTEIDPLSEADVYLAYGRYQQAEELIRQVIAEHPNRHDCKLKLLEIFHTSENKPEFDRYVQQLAVEGRQSDAVFWSKVVEMGNEFELTTGLAPSAISNASEPLNTALPMASTDFKPAADEFDFDLNAFSPALGRAEKADSPAVKTAASAFNMFGESGSEATENEDFKGSRFGGANGQAGFLDEKAISDLDFELNLYAPDNFSAPAGALVASHEDERQGLDFDLTAFESETVGGNEEEIEFIVEDDGNGVDFDLNAFVNENTNAHDESIEYINEDDGNGLDFNLDTFGESLQTPATPRQALADGFDFNFNDELDESVRDLDFSSASLGANPTSMLPESSGTLEDADEFNFDFDFNLPTGNVSGKGGGAFDNLEVSDLTDAENVFETKVNLANAYVDMGDVAAAKEIANDLLKGSAEQKKAGQQILEKIS